MFFTSFRIIKCGFSSSHAIYTIKSVVNEYCDILSGGILVCVSYVRYLLIVK